MCIHYEVNTREKCIQRIRVGIFLKYLIASNMPETNALSIHNAVQTLKCCSMLCRLGNISIIYIILNLKEKIEKKKKPPINQEFTIYKNESLTEVQVATN